MYLLYLSFLKLQSLHGEFIPAVTRLSVGELERKLFALPVHLGGLGLAFPSAIAGFSPVGNTMHIQCKVYAAILGIAKVLIITFSLYIRGANMMQHQ